MIWLVLFAVLVAACGGVRQEEGALQAVPDTAQSERGGVAISVVGAAYGSLSVRTAPGGSCTADIRFTGPDLGENPPPTTGLTARADASGLATWTYATPRLPADDRVPYQVWCEDAGKSATVSGTFRVERRAVSAASFSVRLQAGPPRDPVGPENPALVPLRDKATAQLRSTLANEWRAATRELSSLGIADGGADILISVIAARGTSLHRTAKRDGSEDIVVFVADDRGPTSVENIVAITMHELGHIWCCFGPGTNDGHWATPQEEPGLYGVDRFGLMNHPIDCKVYTSGVTSCPNRFSERELRAFGFTSIPPPPPSACSRVPALKAERDQLRAELPALKSQIDLLDAQASTTLSQIRAIDAQYPSKVLPPDVYARYTALVDQYNALVRDEKAKVDSYNAKVDRSNALAAELNSLVGC